MINTAGNGINRVSNNFTEVNYPFISICKISDDKSKSKNFKGKIEETIDYMVQQLESKGNNKGEELLWKSYGKLTVELNDSIESCKNSYYNHRKINARYIPAIEFKKDTALAIKSHMATGKSHVIFLKIYS